MITREEYDLALNIVEAYHKQTMQIASKLNPRNIFDIKKGDYVRVVKVNKPCLNSLTLEREYIVVDVIKGWKWNKDLFFIIDDKGKKKRYNFDNRQFVLT